MNQLETSSEQELAETRWYRALDRRKVGPLSLEQLQELIAEGELKPTDMVLREGTPRWIAAASVPGLIDSEHEEEAQERKLFPPRFYVDLKAVFRTIHVDPKEHLRILAEQFERRHGVIREKRKPFVFDLARVFAIVAKDPKKDLEILEKRFAAWREWTLGELKRYYPLEKSDPLCCAISLFGTMDYGRLERAHTKVLAWFLDPHKEHEFGSILLARLLQHLQDNQILPKLNDASVRSEAEKLLPEAKRLDIYVEGNDEGGETKRWFLVVEGKVDAQEGSTQLEDYDGWIGEQLEHKGEVTRVFLTPDGRKPATSTRDWISLSFLDLACVFRGALTHLQEKPGYHFLRYYLTGILKDVCRWNLPIREPEKCDDPYGFLTYLRSVHKGGAKGGQP